jgi:multidrug efflux pump
MKFAHFFVDRPIFASVLSIMIFIAGLIAMFQLPVSEYPEVAPPSVVVSAQFPGANPAVIAETVATPLEEAVNGVDDMLYMSSLATTDGRLQLTVTFKIGKDPDLAQQLVQNRVSQALPRLPDIVRQIGVVVVKSSPELTMVVHLISPNGRYDDLYLRNYGVLNVRDTLKRLPGVGQIELFGAGDYAMRIWLDPGKISERGLAASDVINAIRGQNIQVAAGQIGGPPYADNAEIQLPINAQGRLQTPEQFDEIIVKTDGEGAVTRLKDVARTELAAQEYGLRSLLNNKPAVGIAVFAAPGSNALQISQNVRTEMEKIKADFPEDVAYDIVYDPTVFVQESIDSVVHTLFEALLLVVLVVIVFLQTWRASLIPLLAVPVSIIGTFAVMYVLGFSINVLSLFGLILAIGIVVDDAIVVVENVERHLEKGKSRREAVAKAMREVTGPIIATTLVLTSVFIPIAFISGLTGQFYKQFALTIAIATVISMINSLTLSPALSVILLKPKNHGNVSSNNNFFRLLLNKIFSFVELINKTIKRYFMVLLFFSIFINVCDFVLNDILQLFSLPNALSEFKTLLTFIFFILVLFLFFANFNLIFDRFTSFYTRTVSFAIRFKPVMLILYACLIVATYIGFQMVPTGYVPQQDKQYLVAFAQLPPGATLDRTEAVIRKMSEIGLNEPGVRDSVAFPGLSINGLTNSSSAGIVFLGLKPFDERRTPDLSAGAIAGKIQQKYFGIDEGLVFIFPPPSVSGLGTIGGFKLQVQDRTDQGYQALDNAMKAVIAKAYQTPELMGVFSSYNINVPQLFADLNRTKAVQLGVPVSDVFDTMQIYLGSLYINDFNKFGRTYQVVAQADKQFRARPEDISNLKVRSLSGEMVPLGALMEIKESFGPETAMRYNGFRTADLNGDAGIGFSSGQAQAAITKILNETLPKGMGFEWTDLTYQQILAGNTAILVFPLCIFLVFLVLAAQYESLTLPLAIIMIVPLAILSAIVGIYVTGGDNNIFTQIALFVLAGLACKNAILIVEFARELEMEGRSIVEAAVEASRLRLRPILMTSFAFIMGVVPLVLSEGAGAEMRQAIGVAVFSGMLGVTFFGIFFTPVFYVLFRKLAEGLKKETANLGRADIYNHTDCL